MTHLCVPYASPDTPTDRIAFFVSRVNGNHLYNHQNRRILSEGKTEGFYSFQRRAMLYAAEHGYEIEKVDGFSLVYPDIHLGWFKIAIKEYDYDPKKHVVELFPKNLHFISYQAIRNPSIVLVLMLGGDTYTVETLGLDDDENDDRSFGTEQEAYAHLFTLMKREHIRIYLS